MNLQMDMNQVEKLSPNDLHLLVWELQERLHLMRHRERQRRHLNMTDAQQDQYLKEHPPKMFICRG